jgi:GUN4-like
MFTQTPALALHCGVASSIEHCCDAGGTRLQRGVDYEPLRKALKEADFLKADDIHRKKLIEVAGADAQERGWVYFSEVRRHLPLMQALRFSRIPAGCSLH